MDSLCCSFPTEVSVSSSTSTQVTGEIDVISAITRISFNPTTDKWSLDFDTSVQAPFILQGPIVSTTGGEISSKNRYDSDSLSLGTVTGCSSNLVDCQQKTSLKFKQGSADAPCDALSGSITIKYNVTCAQGLGSECPLFGNETVAILLTLATGSSCPATDTITFTATTLNSFADAAATTARTSFITNQIAYFAAVITSSDAEIATKTVKPGSVCFQIGSNTCHNVNFTSLGASGQYEPIFSIDFEDNMAVFQNLTIGANSAASYAVHAVIQVTFTGATSKRSFLVSSSLGKRRQLLRTEKEINTIVELKGEDSSVVGVGEQTLVEDNLANSNSVFYPLLFTIMISFFWF